MVRHAAGDALGDVGRGDRRVVVEADGDADLVRLLDVVGLAGRVELLPERVAAGTDDPDRVAHRPTLLLELLVVREPPLGDVDPARQPDVARRLAVLEEAAQRAGVSSSAPLLGRPTCMAIPLAMSGSIATSLGCVGNRVYTEIPDDELYVTVSGKDLQRVVDQLETIGTANQALKDYHTVRRATLLTA